MKQALSITALAALAACGGGGGGGSAPFAAPVAATAVAPSAPVAHAAIPAPVVAAQEAPQPINTNCVTTANHTDCELEANASAIGIGIAGGSYATFTNHTSGYLQINSISAYTGEQAHWSEFCAYLNVFMTGQDTEGNGEVGCSTKNVGEDYSPIGWGDGTGLSVAPGGVVYLGSHTEPASENHTYSLMVSAQTSGVNAWRFPAHDVVNACNGIQQSTPWTPWQNTTDHSMTVRGVSIYVAAGGSTPNDLTGSACIYVLNADGTTKATVCNDSLRTRGDVALGLTLQPGESIAGQAVNTCQAPGTWGWAAYLQVY